jgi:hypothetical protein
MVKDRRSPNEALEQFRILIGILIEFRHRAEEPLGGLKEHGREGY